MKYSTLDKAERKMMGIGVILSLGIIVSALSYYGFKDWMYLGFSGMGIMVYLMFSESELLDFGMFAKEREGEQ